MIELKVALAAGLLMMSPFAGCSPDSYGDKADHEYAPYEHTGDLSQAIKTAPSSYPLRFDASGVPDGFYDVTAAWIPREGEARDSRLVVGFTAIGASGNPQAGHGYYSPGFRENPGDTRSLYRWNEPSPHKSWPLPENLCENSHPAPCAGSTPPFGYHWVYNYTRTVQMLYPGLYNTAVAVAIFDFSLEPNGLLPRQCIVLLSSTDGGESFDKAKIVDCTGVDDPPVKIDPDTIAATVKVSDSAPRASHGTNSEPIFVVWRDISQGSYPYAWHSAAAEVDASGDIEITVPKHKLPMDWSALGSVAIAAYDDSDGDLWVQIVSSHRRDAEGLPAPHPGCPSQEQFSVEWTIWATNEYGAFPPVWQSNLLYADNRWKPCVGASHSSSGPDLFPNSDRPSIVVHRSVPKSTLYAISTSEFTSMGWGTGPNHVVRVFESDLVEEFYELEPPSFDSTVRAEKRQVFMSPITGQDKYGPELVIHHGLGDATSPQSSDLEAHGVTYEAPFCAAHVARPLREQRRGIWRQASWGAVLSR